MRRAPLLLGIAIVPILHSGFTQSIEPLRFLLPLLLMLTACGSGDAPATEETAAAGTRSSAAVAPQAEMIFNGVDLTGWVGDVEGYVAQDSAIVCLPGKGGNLYFDRELSDFELEFEFKLTPGANNGVGIRAEQGKDAAYYGMEIQVIDNLAPKWAEIRDWQVHGSIYGIVAAERGHLRPAGEWNRETIRAVGNRITVTLNDHVIVDSDIAEATADSTLSGREHPGLFNESGYIGFLGHGDEVAYRRIYLTDLSDE